MATRLESDDDDDAEDFNDINVTPFIDVILVLLIIFMVAAPLATVAVPVDLPTAAAKPQPQPPHPVYLTVRSDLSLTVGEQPVTRETLAATLGAATLGTAGRSEREDRIFLRADKTVPYGDVMAVMTLLKEAGYLKVALMGVDTGDLK